jgi:hypothetical protein
MAEIQGHCDTHQDIVGFKYSFPHLTRSLKLQRKIKIVAIGSSSTAGEGDVVPYPARLELLLRAAFHDRMIDVLNRGMSGQEAPSELSRFEPDVIGEAPALVIWQVGTNAVFRKEEFNFDDVAGSIATGLGWLASLPTDVVLMDLQYATAVVVPDEKKGVRHRHGEADFGCGREGRCQRVSPFRADAALESRRRHCDGRLDPPGRSQSPPYERLGHQLRHASAL